MRLDGVISKMKIAARKEIKQVVKEGIITVNGVIMKKPSERIGENNDAVRIYDEIVEYRKLLYLVMDKRKGVMSHSKDPTHKTVINDMGESRVFDLSPVGRLNLDTAELLITTNDGKFAYDLISPRKDVSEKYKVTLRDKVDEKYNDTFERGTKLIPGDIIAKPARTEAIDDYNCYLAIKEGKYYQVKRMFERVGNKVVEFQRVQIGDFKLPGNPEERDFREFTGEELGIPGLEE